MQATKIDADRSCQPLKQSVSALPLRNVAFKNAPLNLQRPSNDVLEKKYNFACELIAAYKNAYFAEKFKNLQDKRSCCI